MEDRNQDCNSSSCHGSSSSSNHERQGSNSEPVRSRWSPKPEQILILESIFSSGMVNPPKDETVRIRKLLEKFGSVGDANVFYWFQNRRSRSRRRQRQLQAATGAEQIRTDHNKNNNFHMAPAQTQAQAVTNHVADAIPYENHNNGSSCADLALPMGFASNSCNNFMVGASSSSSSCGVMGDDGDMVDQNLYSMAGQMGFQELGDSMLCPSDSSTLQYQTGFITVFINGVPTEIPRGPIDMRALFGKDVVLVHSTGVPLPTNQSGFLLQNLQHGESYFLVSRSA